ncbi:hypothetical protein SNEBB_007616 [Seison nebaliae]|nr:hypothetical protein SNEBB_007616 [Seison nebaliae]
MTLEHSSRYHNGNRLSCDEMDSQRIQQAAYEYLCRLETAKKRLYLLLDRQLDEDSLLDFENSLANGIILSKLSFKLIGKKENWTMYDEDGNFFNQIGLQFRHTENINNFINSTKLLGIPNYIVPETTDIYDRKNLPKLINCLHYLLERNGAKVEEEEDSEWKTFTRQEMETIEKRVMENGKEYALTCEIPKGMKSLEKILDENNYEEFSYFIKLFHPDGLEYLNKIYFDELSRTRKNCDNLIESTILNMLIKIDDGFYGKTIRNLIDENNIENVVKLMGEIPQFNPSIFSGKEIDSEILSFFLLMPNHHNWKIKLMRIKTDFIRNYLISNYEDVKVNCYSDENLTLEEREFKINKFFIPNRIVDELENWLTQNFSFRNLLLEYLLLLLQFNIKNYQKSFVDDQEMKFHKISKYVFWKVGDSFEFDEEFPSINVVVDSDLKMRISSYSKSKNMLSEKMSFCLKYSHLLDEELLDGIECLEELISIFYFLISLKKLMEEIGRNSLGEFTREEFNQLIGVKGIDCLEGVKLYLEENGENDKDPNSIYGEIRKFLCDRYRGIVELKEIKKIYEIIIKMKDEEIYWEKEENSLKRLNIDRIPSEIMDDLKNILMIWFPENDEWKFYELKLLFYIFCVLHECQVEWTEDEIENVQQKFLEYKKKLERYWDGIRRIDDMMENMYMGNPSTNDKCEMTILKELKESLILLELIVEENDDNINALLNRIICIFQNNHSNGILDNRSTTIHLPIDVTDFISNSQEMKETLRYVVDSSLLNYSLEEKRLMFQECYGSNVRFYLPFFLDRQSGLLFDEENKNKNLTLQSVNETMLNRKIIQKEICAQKMHKKNFLQNFIIPLQCQCRRYLERREVIERESAILIQSMFRGYVSRKETLPILIGYFEKRENAANRIKRFWKRKRWQRNLNERIVKKNEASRIISRFMKKCFVDFLFGKIRRLIDNTEQLTISNVEAFHIIQQFYRYNRRSISQSYKLGEDCAVKRLKLADLISELNCIEKKVEKLDMKIGLLIQNRMALMNRESEPTTSRMEMFDENCFYNNKSDFYINSKMEKFLGENVNSIVNKHHLSSSNLKKNEERALSTWKSTGNMGIRRWPYHELMEIFSKLFFLFQTYPMYLAKLISGNRHLENLQFFQSFVLTLFNYGANEREEYLLYKLFEKCIEYEIEQTTSPPNFLSNQPLFIKCLVTYCKKYKKQSTLNERLKESICLAMKEKQLRFPIMTIDVYRRIIQEKETDTGLAEDVDFSKLNEEELLKMDEIRERINDNLSTLTDVVQNIVDSIIRRNDDCHSQIPYIMRACCCKIYEEMKEKYENVTDKDILKIIGNIIYYRYINPIIIQPMVYQLANRSLTTDERQFFGYVSLVLQYASNGKGFKDKGGTYLFLLNDQMTVWYSQMSTFFYQLITDPLKFPKKFYHIDDLNENIHINKQYVYISSEEILRFHTILRKSEQFLFHHFPFTHYSHFASLLSSSIERYDHIRDALGKMTDIVERKFPSKTVKKNENIRLQLIDPSPKTVLSSLHQSMSVFNCKKRMEEVVRRNYDIQIDEFDPDNLAHYQPARNFNARHPEKISIGEEELLKLPTETIVTNLKETMLYMLESRKIDNPMSYILHQNIIDIRHYQQYSLRLKREIIRLNQLMDILNIRFQYFTNQMASYEKYMNRCLQQQSIFQDKNRKKKEIHSYRYTAKELREKGIIQLIHILGPKNHSKIIFYITSSDDDGVFYISVSYRDMRYESRPIFFQDLLQSQHEGIRVLTFFNRFQVNVNLLIHFINNKFYKKISFKQKIRQLF